MNILARKLQLFFFEHYVHSFHKQQNMASEEEILDMDHDDDNSLEEDAMFYNANFSEESESNTKSYELGEQTIWNDHKTKEHDMEKYTLNASRLQLQLLTSSSKPGIFVPKDKTKFQWDSTDLNDDYCGHLIRLYLESAQVINTTKCNINETYLPEKDCLFISGEPLEVARYSIEPKKISEEGAYETSSFLQSDLTYRVESVYPGIIGVNDDNNVSVSEEELSQVGHHHKGSFSIDTIQFGFVDLLGIYVRKKFIQEKQKLSVIRRKRPVSRGEKEYVKALAKAAREAPGNAQTFRGMKGWQ